MFTSQANAIAAVTANGRSRFGYYRILEVLLLEQNLWLRLERPDGTQEIALEKLSYCDGQWHVQLLHGLPMLESKPAHEIFTTLVLSSTDFASGKQYNADLNGANNIAARGLAWLLGIENPRSAKAANPTSQSLASQPEALAPKGRRLPGEGTRMPFVLADVWAHARTLRGHLTASGVSIDAPSKSPAAIH